MNREQPTTQEAPQLFTIAAQRPAPARFRRLYARLERALASLHMVFHAWGTTAEDRAMSFPCDAYVRSPTCCYYRGIDVLAPAEIVYRWLCQLRVAPYAYDWVDNLGRQSPRQLTPGAELLCPGQRILVMFEVAEFAPGEQITIRVARFQSFFGEELAMTYRVVPRNACSCRIVCKFTAKTPPPTFIGRFQRDYFVIGELPFMRKQLLTFKQLAERQFLEELADGRLTATGSVNAPYANGSIDRPQPHLSG